jgi:hypothetical protein
LWERNREEVFSNLRSFVRVPLSPLYENFYFKTYLKMYPNIVKEDKVQEDISSLKMTDGEWERI